MKIVNKTALVPYSAQQMYVLVKEVENYPKFLPWCAGANTLEQFDDGVLASVDIKKNRLEKTFTTRNVFITNKKISMSLVEGPFSKLQGAWTFDAIGDDGCRVSLYLEFDFSSSVASMTIGPIFNLIADKLLDSFVEQADKTYG